MSWFKPNKYNEPRPMPPSPAPTEEKPRANIVGVDDSEQFLEIRLFFNDQESIQKALGTLEIAKDIIKRKMVEWRQRQRQPSILVPNNGRSH